MKRVTATIGSQSRSTRKHRAAKTQQTQKKYHQVTFTFTTRDDVGEQDDLKCFNELVKIVLIFERRGIFMNYLCQSMNDP